MYFCRTICFQVLRVLNFLYLTDKKSVCDYMHKEEAIFCLKTVYNSFPVNVVTFDSSALNGYQVIVNVDSELDRNTVKEIAKQLNLAIKSSGSDLILYKP